MPDWIPSLALALLALLALNLLLLIALFFRRTEDQSAAHAERLERELRDELGRQGQSTRADLGTFQQMLLTQSGDVARTQNEQIDSFRAQLAVTHEQSETALRRFGQTLTEQLRLLSEANERRLMEVRQAVDLRLQALQDGNRRSSTRCVPPSTRSCTRHWSSVLAKASSRWPTVWSRCTAAWAKCKPWRATWAR